MYFKHPLVLVFATPCCPICDQQHPLVPFTHAPSLHSDDGTNWGEVCGSCYDLSSEEIKQKLLQKANLEASIAQQTTQLAQEPVHKTSLEQEFQLYRRQTHE